MENVIQLKNGDCYFSCRLPSGKYNLETDTFHLKNASPVLKIEQKQISCTNWKLLQAAENEFLTECETESGKLLFHVQSYGRGFRMKLKFSRAQVNDQQIDLFYFDQISISAEHVITQGLSGSGCSSYKLDSEQENDFQGYFLCTISQDGIQTQFSTSLKCKHLLSFAGTAQKGEISNFSAGAEVRFYSGEEIELEPLQMQSGQGFAMLKQYADENKSEKKNFSEPVTSGWNSWDYYRWTITEDDVLENADFIAADPILSKHVKKIIIDDGWEYAYGEWEANSHFPHGMKYIADQIKKRGFEPGLWVAPLIAEPHSIIAQKHPEMLAKAVNGNPTLCWECMRRYAFVLDPTAKESAQFLDQTFERLLSYGFRYFKLDFLNAVMRARQFTDKSVPKGHLMNSLVGRIRNTVQGKAEILGCNYMFNGGADLVDSARIGGDVLARWSNIKHNALSIASRYWANKKLWINDPDFALCRSSDTANDPEMYRLLPFMIVIQPDDTITDHGGMKPIVDVSSEQIKVLLSLVIASAGQINFSDRMSRLNETGLDFARRTVAAERGETAIPLDLFESEVPKYWLQKVGNHHRILMINWEDVPGELTFDLSAHGITGRSAVDFWTDEPVRIKSGKLQEVLPPRSCLFINI